MTDTSTTETAATPNQAPAAGHPGTTPRRQSSTSFESLAVVGLVLGLFAIVISMFALGLAARAANDSSGGGGESGAAVGGGTGAESVDISMAEFAFDPPEGTLAPDGTINLENTGSVAHDMVLDDLESGLVDPGASGTLELGGLAPGEYVVYCSVPGHREAGMEGTITVD